MITRVEPTVGSDSVQINRLVGLFEVTERHIFRDIPTVRRSSATNGKRKIPMLVIPVHRGDRSLNQRF